MENNKLSCIEVNRIDLVDFLSNLGYAPQLVRNHDYWYVSPFRNERTPSFKVNRKLNVWFDFGEGKGGRLVDFGIQYFNCSVSELLTRGGDITFQFFFENEAVSASESKRKNIPSFFTLETIEPCVLYWIHKKDWELVMNDISKVPGMRNKRIDVILDG